MVYPNKIIPRRENMKKGLLVIFIMLVLTTASMSTVIGYETPDNDTRQGGDGSLKYYIDNGMGRNVFKLFSQNKEKKNWRLTDEWPYNEGANNVNSADLNSSYNSAASAMVFDFPYDGYPLAGLTAQYESGVTPYANMTVNTNYASGKVIHFEVRFDTNGDGAFETKALFNTYTTTNDPNQGWQEEYVKQYSTGYTNGPPGNMNNGLIQMAFWRTDGIIDIPGNAVDEDWLTISCGGYGKWSWVALPYKWPDLNPRGVIGPDDDQDPHDWWVEPPTDPLSPHRNGYVANNTITLHGSGSTSPLGYNITDYYWIFGDDVHSTHSNPNTASGEFVEHFYKYPGVYYIELKVTDTNYRSGWTSHWINIGKDPGIPPEITSFSISPNPALVNSQVDFSVMANDPDGHATLPIEILYYQWDFDGDGQWDTDLTEDPEPTHIYSEAGNYNVKVAVYDGPGTHNDTQVTAEEKLLTVKENEGPVLNFTVSTAFDSARYPGDDDLLIIVGEEVTLDLTKCYDPDSLPGIGNNPHYSIQTKVDFKDGLGELIRYDDDTVYKYNYTKAGPYNKYTIAITVSDGDIEEKVTFHVYIDVPPEANAGPDLGSEYTGEGELSTGEVVYFNGSLSFDPNDDKDGNGKIDGSEMDNCTYKWDFGDNSSSQVSSSPLTQHTYTEPDVYTVSLTVTDPRGQSSRDTLMVYILTSNKLPVAVIEITEGKTTFDSYELIHFDAVNSYDADNDTGGTIIDYIWDFGDGTNSTGSAVTHQYTDNGPDNGQYIVTLYVIDNRNGESEPTTKVLMINNQKPVGKIRRFTDEDWKTKTEYTFESESEDIDGKIVAYYWEIDGVKISDWGNDSSIKYTFDKHGEYKVKLMVRDDDGAINAEGDLLSVYTVDIPEKKKPKSPGFEMTFVIMAIVIVGLLYIKRRR